MRIPLIHVHVLLIRIGLMLPFQVTQDEFPTFIRGVVHENYAFRELFAKATSTKIALAFAVIATAPPTSEAPFLSITFESERCPSTLKN